MVHIAEGIGCDFVQKQMWIEKWWFLWSIMIGISACFCFNGSLILSGFTKLFAEDYNNTTSTIYRGTVITTVLTTGFLAPILEEFLYRYIIYGQLRKQLFQTSFWKACFLSALIFAIAHRAIVQGVYGFLTGILLCYCYEYKGGIKVTLAIHIAMNLTSIIVTQVLNSVSSSTDTFILTVGFFLGTFILFLSLYKTSLSQK